MIYACSDMIYPIELSDMPALLSKEIPTVAYLSLEEFAHIAPQVGIRQSTIDLLVKPSVHFRSSFFQTEDYVFGSFQLVDVANIMESSGKIAVIVASVFCIFVNLGDEDDEIIDVFDQTISRCKTGEFAVEKVLYLFFDSLLMEDAARIEDIEFEFNLLEDRVVAKQVEEDFYKILIARKRELFVLHNYYEQFLEFVDVLEENELGLFTNKNKKYLRMMDHKFDRLKQDTLLLRECLVQLREAYQSYLDYSLNNVMKLFTVVTTIFLPLTLIVGWYGMNFQTMPELAWKYGYAYVIVLAVLVVLVCIWIFRKKKLM